MTWQIATDASYPPDEWMSGTKIVGLDVSIMSAIATTLGAKYDESNVDVFGDHSRPQVGQVPDW